MQNDKFDAIPIPRELSSVVKAGIQEGIREQKQFRRKRLLLRYSMAAAALVLVCVGVLLVSDPTMAAKLPLIGRIFSMVQERVSYKGDFSDDAQVYVEEESGSTQGKKDARTSGERSDGVSGAKADNPYVQTSNGLTVTVSEANCTGMALYLALCIENEEDFPADFIKTKNMEGYLHKYDSLSLVTESYYDLPGLGKEDRGTGMGYSSPYYIEGNFVDSRTFTGIIRVSLEEDLMGSGGIGNQEIKSGADQNQGSKVKTLPEQFTYYLEISDIYGELMEYEDIQVRDPESNGMITIPEVVMKHYEGTWKFAIKVNKNQTEIQNVKVNKTNEKGVGIAFVERTEFEIRAQILLPEGAKPYDYVITIFDAEGKQLDSQGENAEVFSTYGRDTDTVYVYVCDYMQFMDELKGDEKKIMEGALFEAQVNF